MLAVATSDMEALPHQLKAVYGELLPRTPLRFRLADDPGAGKTIMAGLYVKELMLRGDLARCLDSAVRGCAARPRPRSTRPACERTSGACRRQTAPLRTTTDPTASAGLDCADSYPGT